MNEFLKKNPNPNFILGRGGGGGGVRFSDFSFTKNPNLKYNFFFFFLGGGGGEVMRGGGERGVVWLW